MTTRFAVACDLANMDQSGKLNLIGAFNAFGASELPFVHKRFVIAGAFDSTVVRADDPYTVTCTVLTPSGAVAFREQLPGRIESDAEINFDLPVAINVIVEIANMPFAEAGKYRVELTVEAENDSAAHEIDLYVVRFP